MNYRICTRCIMDTSDPNIEFDQEGVCNHCREAELRIKSMPIKQNNSEELLDLLITDIKRNGKNRKYDCIIGLSGGVDSSYAALKVKEKGLRPLAVHFDNSWNSELANSNIENICKLLDIDLFTYVVNWKEFRDIQLSFVKASTADWEIPTDHAIYALLSTIAVKHNVKYILAGRNSASESILPKAWSYGHSDWKYIKNVHKLYGKEKIKTFPHYTIYKRLYWMFIKKIKYIAYLDYFNYDKVKAKKEIIEKLNWRDYGAKHHESIYTKLYQSYFLPLKFGYNKNRAHLASLIVAGQITREQALEEVKKPTYNKDTIQNDIDYFINKFEITNAEYDLLMSKENTYFDDYKNNENSGLTRLVYKVIFKVREMRKKK